MSKHLDPAIRILVATLLLLTFLPVQQSRAEVKVTLFGDLDFAVGGYWDAPLAYEVLAPNVSPDQQDDSFLADMRVRVITMIESSEYARGFFYFRLAKARIGEKQSPAGDLVGYQLDGDKSIMRVRQAWMEWGKLEDPLKFRAGLIQLRTPAAAFYSAILDSSGGGMEILYKFNDTATANLVWTRPYDDTVNDGLMRLQDEVDLFQLKVPLTFSEPKLLLTPWAMYGRFGKDSSFWHTHNAKHVTLADKNNKYIQDNGKGFWAGLALGTEFDKLSIKYDFAYGQLLTSENTTHNYNTKGWHTFVALDYHTDWGIPGLFGWYASGSKQSDTKNKRMWGTVPGLSAADVQFNPTSFGFANSSLDDSAGVIRSTFVSNSPGGTWGVGVQLNRASVRVKDLQHVLRFAYYGGTNDNELARNLGRDGNIDLYLGRQGIFLDRVVLTKGDRVFEVNFNHHYKVSQDTDIFVSLGYLNLNYGSHWFENSPNYKDRGYNKDRHAWQAAVNFRYTFK